MKNKKQKANPNVIDYTEYKKQQDLEFERRFKETYGEDYKISRDYEEEKLPDHKVIEKLHHPYDDGYEKTGLAEDETEILSSIDIYEAGLAPTHDFWIGGHLYSDDFDKIVFLTPRFLFDLRIGIDKALFPNEEDWDTEYPFSMEEVIKTIEETSWGSDEGQYICLPVEGSSMKVYFCVEVFGKLYKLHRDELAYPDLKEGVPISRQVKLFQRLVYNKELDVDILAMEKMDEKVYKQLIANSATPLAHSDIQDIKLKKVYEKLNAQLNNKKYRERVRKIKENLCAE